MTLVGRLEPVPPTVLGMKAEWESAYRTFLALPGKWDWLLPWAQESKCLPIYCDWTHAFGLRSDSEVIAYEHEPWPGTETRTLLHASPCVVTHLRLLNLAIVEGAKRFPWLIDLRPARPPDAQACSMCGETGALPAPLVCYCGGAGWVPGDDTWVNHKRLSR